MTGLLGLLGAYLGEDELLLGVSPSENAKGFFEYVPILELNEKCLEVLGGSWDDPPDQPRGWESRADLVEVREEAARIAQRLADGAEGSQIAFKDPRTCLTLPLWRQVVDVDAAVVCLRHPDAVAGSLRRRNGLDEDVSARLWLRYTGAALAESSDVTSRVVVVYEHLIDDVEAASRRLTEALDLPEPDADTVRRLRDFVDGSLSHHVPREPPTWSLALRLARHAYGLLVDGGDPEGLLPLLGAGARDGMPGVVAKLDTADRLPDLAADLEQERARLEQLTAELAASRELAQQHEERIGELRSELQHAYERLEGSGEELARLASRRAVRAAIGLSAAVRAPARFLRRMAGRRRQTGAISGTGPETTTGGAGSNGHGPRAISPTTIKALEELGPVTVVVPIHNAAEHLARCVASIRRNTRHPHELVLVDDASSEAQVEDLLTEFEQLENVTVLRNDVNEGFSATVNRGLASCDTDVVVLNS
ncbi:MAG: glycosyltransferase, partial [Nitriliruptorales bacterium]|nr:glycosyltransferase [Nitriliruptorales bacterium]